MLNKQIHLKIAFIFSHSTYRCIRIAVWPYNRICPWHCCVYSFLVVVAFILDTIHFFHIIYFIRLLVFYGSLRLLFICHGVFFMDRCASSATYNSCVLCVFVYVLCIQYNIQARRNQQQWLSLICIYFSFRFSSTNRRSMFSWFFPCR